MIFVPKKMFSKKKVFTWNQFPIFRFSSLESSVLKKKGLNFESVLDFWRYFGKPAGTNPKNRDCPTTIETYGKPSDVA